jgi:alpha-glutamyl/putrescinyl thymine pyrophosphorylase clade 1
MRTKELFAFMQERHRIYERRAAGDPKPWTQDPILQRFKFTNVYRELDRVTIWIRENIREPFAYNPNLWLMLCIARRINWPDTLAELIADKKGAWPVKTLNPERLTTVLDARTARKEQVYTGAYMITATSTSVGQTKSRATAYNNVGELWNKRKVIVPKLSGTCQGAFEAICGSGFAWGPFMTAQVIVDMKFTRYLRDAPDFWTWAHSGPGSRRGLNRVLGRDKNAPWREEDWRAGMSKVYAALAPLIEKAKMPRLSMSDCQNVLCEFDKYERVRLGEGRPRSLYPGV